MGFANLAYVTDSDTGHDGSAPVTAGAVFERLRNAQEHILTIVAATVAAIGGDYVPPRLMDQSAVDRVMAQPASRGAMDAG